ncbi:MAG: LPS export ABC transporter periplasmic protein LptC [Spirochaetota bacterium]
MLITDRNRRLTVRRRGVITALLCLFLVLLGGSCSFEYRREPSQQESRKPSYTLQDTRYTLSDQEVGMLQFRAQEAAFYTKDDLVELNEVEFTQHNTSGEVLSEGSCRYLEVDTGTHNIVFSGNVEIRFTSEQTSIEASRLYWDHNQKLLYSEQDEFVTVYYEDGSQITGMDFTANGKTRQMEFGQETEGIVRYD